MAPRYSIRMCLADGTFEYYADTLGRTGFNIRLAQLIAREQALKGVSCDIVRSN